VRSTSVPRRAEGVSALVPIAQHPILRLPGAGDAAEVYELLTPEGERRALA
jgi:hypothetical protein